VALPTAVQAPSGHGTRPLRSSLPHELQWRGNVSSLGGVDGEVLGPSHEDFRNLEGEFESESESEREYT